jgi:glycolate oxidase iron-sulfur subunit
MSVEKCSLCGLCKSVCPIFRVLLTETSSPRAKAIFIKNNVLDKIFYKCTNCEACEKECPAQVDFQLKKIRAELVERGMETSANKKMIVNIRKHGNPFGEIKKGAPKELYCC